MGGCRLGGGAGPDCCDDRTPFQPHRTPTPCRTPATLLIACCPCWPCAQPPPQADPLKAAAAEPGAVVTDSGLVFRSLKDGSGASPAATDTVRVHYRGTFPDGKEFDSSIKRGQPAEFPLNRVIKCWTEGVQKIKVGGKAKLTCPAAIAYGERGTPAA
jgi:FKBP-type peptidyl-prolyl cis-trans isomerase FkpA